MIIITDDLTLVCYKKVMIRGEGSHTMKQIVDRNISYGTKIPVSHYICDPHFTPYMLLVEHWTRVYQKYALTTF